MSIKTTKSQSCRDLLDDIWHLTGSLWEQNETTEELAVILSKFKKQKENELFKRKQQKLREGWVHPNHLYERPVNEQAFYVHEVNEREK